MALEAFGIIEQVHRYVIACRCLNSQTAFRSVHEPRLDARLSMAVRNELSGESRGDPEVPVSVMV
jgi:hypothetical protein